MLLCFLLSSDFSSRLSASGGEMYTNQASFALSKPAEKRMILNCASRHLMGPNCIIFRQSNVARSCDTLSHMPSPRAGVNPSGMSWPDMCEGWPPKEDRAARLLPEEGERNARRHKADVHESLTYTWMSNRHLKFYKSKMQLFIFTLPVF